MRLVLVSLACVTSVTAAAAEPVGFVWEAPASCPDGDDVRARIEQRLGSPLEIHGVEVAITRTGTRFVAHVDTRGVTVANGVRTLTSTRCEELADAVAVVVARLASEWRRIDRERRAATARRIEVDAPHPEVAGDLADEPGNERACQADRSACVGVAAVASRDAVAVAAAARPGRRYGGGVRALALSGIGTVPRVGVGGELAVFGKRDDLFVEVGVARWASQSAYLVAGAPGRVDVGLDVALIRLGWAPSRMPLRGWIGAEVGAMRGQGAAFTDPQQGSVGWQAVTGGFGVGWPMARNVRLVGTFEVGVPLTRAHFTVAEGSDIYTSSPAAARCALGLELGWP